MKTIIAYLWRRFMPDILVQKLINGTVFTLSLRDHAYWILFQKPAKEFIPWPNGGLVWDLGCNIGVHSVAAALNGCRVVAFDLSPLNIECLRRTCETSEMTLVNSVTGISRPVTRAITWFKPADSGHVTERLKAGGKPSIPYWEAVEIAGVPKFIKMDIEGAERDLLGSSGFKHWVMDHKIEIYLELHAGNESLLWPEFKHIEGNHYLLTHGALE